MADFQLDRAHTDVLFSAKHLMVTNVRGEFPDVDATLDLDEADPTASSVEFRSGPPASTPASGRATTTFARPTSSMSRPTRSSSCAAPRIRHSAATTTS